MKLLLLILISLFLSKGAHSQVSASQVYNATNSAFSVWAAKEFSKDVALFTSKEFLFKHVLDTSKEVIQFEVVPLAAAGSGELTTLLYRCEAQKKEGMVLGFYGTYTSNVGTLLSGYSFRNLSRDEAVDFLSLVQSSIDDNGKFLRDNLENNNIYFRYKDIDVLVSGAGNLIRIFWNGFDSSWEKVAFDRSKRRFERKLK